MAERDELVRVVAEALCHEIRNPAWGETVECRCGWTPDWTDHASGKTWEPWIVQYDEHRATAVADALGEHLARAWDDCIEALVWCLANGPAADAPAYLAAHNPYRTATTERTEP